MIGLYLAYNSTADIPIAITHSKYFNKTFTTNKGKINFSSNCDDVCPLKFFNQTLFLIYNKTLDKPARAINNRCDFIHKYDILVPKKVHSEMIFAMHRIILIIRQKDLSHLVH